MPALDGGPHLRAVRAHPVLRVKLTHDHLSAIGAITPDGRLVMQSQDHAYCAQDVVRFLRLLLRKLPGKLLVIWDGASIHRAQAIKAFLSRGAAKRLHLERRPRYAPELINPQEGVWNRGFSSKWTGINVRIES